MVSRFARDLLAELLKRRAGRCPLDVIKYEPARKRDPDIP
jgi:hypothetical protein